jgi:TolB protein
MLRARSIAVLLAAAGALACGHHHPDPCDFTTAGATWLAFSSWSGTSWDVHVMRADGTCRTPITTDPSRDLSPTWGPKGVLAYASDRGSGQAIWIHSLEVGAERRLDTGTLMADSPTFSPDGSKIAFEGTYAGSVTTSVYVVPAAGGTPIELTPEPVPHGNGGPVFSPDGATVYFVSNRAGGYEIFKIPAAGGAAVRVTFGSGIIGKPALSSDGSRLAYTRLSGGTTDVVLYDPLGLTSSSIRIAGAAEPAFDPGGGRLAVRAPYGGSMTHIALVPLPAGGTADQLSTGGGPDGEPAFAPLGH